MDTHEKKLKQLLSKQPFTPADDLRDILARRCRQAEALVEAEGGIAVLSDFLHATAHIYAGSFGRLAGIERSPLVIPSAFEDEIFRCIPPDDLIERHVMELHYYHFQQSVPLERRADYHGTCRVHFGLKDGRTVAVTHRTCYLESLPNGSVWLGLCRYLPCLAGPEAQAAQTAGIVNHATGQAIPLTADAPCHRLLSPRERQVLALLADGLGSKQIAERLCISTNTVYRHRQNILSTLQVSNTAMAVQIGIRLGLI